MRTFLLALTSIVLVTAQYRSYDGSGNNVANPKWGAANAHYRRDNGQYYYEDNVSVPRGGYPTSTSLPNERFVRNTMIIGGQEEETGLSSDWAWVVGEYLAFETVKTSGNASENWDITIPNGDPYYAAHNGVIGFQRCVFDGTTGTNSSNPRVQNSGASGFIDASTIYGESDALAAWNRNGTGGLLKYSVGPDGELPARVGTDPLPPGVNVVNPSLNVPTSELWIMGSPRVNQQPQSMCLSVLWRREHNRQARVLGAANPSWDDEKTFQEARKRVIALMQHFYQTEYIPMLLGNPNVDPYPGYDANTDPTIDFFFNTVSLRYGHTQVNNVTWRLNDDGTPAAGGHILLRNVFFDPNFLTTGDGCSAIYRGLSAKKHNSPEVNIVDDLKEFLFAKAGAYGLDLLSTNMRRARDVGLPNYGTSRTIYGFTPQISFNYSEWADNFRTAYGTDDPTQCDPWICCLLESGINGGELGEVNHEVVRRQFTRLMKGDRFWYENNQFDNTELNVIKSTKLSHIILRNSKVSTMKCDVFEVPGDPYTGTVGPMCNAPSPNPTTTGPASTTAGASSIVPVMFFDFF
jgi:peroxidase